MRVRESKWLVVDQTDSPDARVYHTRLRLLDDFVVQGLAKNAEAGELHFEPCAVLEFALGIRGVAAAEARAYQLTVVKSPAVSWDEVESELLPLFHGARLAASLEELDLADAFAGDDSSSSAGADQTRDSIQGERGGA